MIQSIYEFFENVLFPELRHYDRSARDRLLREARNTPIDWNEWAGILAALVVVVLFTRYNAAGFGILDRVAVAAVNFLVAAVLLGVLAGPFLIRRAGRGLRPRLS